MDRAAKMTQPSLVPSANHHWSHRPTITGPIIHWTRDCVLFMMHSVVNGRFYEMNNKDCTKKIGESYAPFIADTDLTVSTRMRAACFHKSRAFIIYLLFVPGAV